MTVAVFVTNQADAKCLIPWGVHFATAENVELLVVCPRRSKGKRGWDTLKIADEDDSALHQAIFEILNAQDPERVVLKQNVAEGNESTDMDRVSIETRELTAPNPEAAFVEEIGDLGVKTLLLPAHHPVKGTSEEGMRWPQILFAEAPCRVVAIRGTAPELGSPLRVLVASEEQISSDEILSLSKACQLAKNSSANQTDDQGSVTLLYVRPDDDDVARHVAEKHLRQLEKSVSESSMEIKSHFELADSLCDGIRQMSLESFDLILVGTRDVKTIRALMRDLVPADDADQFSLATMRESVPFSDQLWSRFKNTIRSHVPQLDREHRVKLVDRLRAQSRFDFDFLALISLSTLIAALGLAKNSGAIVIGAMLVAPLMTPLVAMGFALVQGNLKLLQNALKSVVLGFAVAVLIGLVTGAMLRLFSPEFAITSEMGDRGWPNVLDLVVALASGIAGAYAMGRPNLVSAIPGVAIAAALVPPIATSGLALAMGDPTLAGGAALLFFTNIVAIVLGTAITFWAVGISSRVSKDRRSAQAWPRYLFLAFVVLSLMLAMEMYFYPPDSGNGGVPEQLMPTRPPAGSNIQSLLNVD